MTTLRNVMLINAVSSGATGLLLLLFSGPTAGLFGASSKMPFVSIGIFLLTFAVLVFIQSRKMTLHKGWVKFIIILDILWAIESLIIIVPKMFGFSFMGYVLIAAVAFWVTLMAVLQAKGLKQFAQSH